MDCGAVDAERSRWPRCWSVLHLCRRTEHNAALAPLGLAIHQFANFDDQLRLLQGITGALPRDFETLANKIRELGRTTSFTAAEVAQGATALARAGFDVSQIETALPAILNLSRATGAELAEAADIAGNALRGFGLSTDQTSKVVDILTATANGSAQNLTDLFSGRLKLCLVTSRRWCCTRCPG